MTCARRSTTASGEHRPGSTFSASGTSRHRRAGVSRLEDAINAGRFVVTAELLTVNAGGLDAVQNAGAPPYDYRVDRAWKKVRAGARFLQLQVSYEPQRLSAFMHEAVEKGLASACALIPSICLVRSPSALRYMDEKVPGITVPKETIERCESASDPEQACFDVACELA